MQNWSPRYADQQCLPRGRKKKVQDEDDEPLSNLKTADEVMMEMEDRCRRESLEKPRKEKKRRKDTKGAAGKRAR